VSATVLAAVCCAFGEPLVVEAVFAEFGGKAPLSRHNGES
jgi:hypothetical protein